MVRRASSFSSKRGPIILLERWIRRLAGVLSLL
jgi:hypothetical protein